MTSKMSYTPSLRKNYQPINHTGSKFKRCQSAGPRLRGKKTRRQPRRNRNRERKNLLKREKLSKQEQRRRLLDKIKRASRNQFTSCGPKHYSGISWDPTFPNGTPPNESSRPRTASRNLSPFTNRLTRVHQISPPHGGTGVAGIRKTPVPDIMFHDSSRIDSLQDYLFQREKKMRGKRLRTDSAAVREEASIRNHIERLRETERQKYPDSQLENLSKRKTTNSSRPHTAMASLSRTPHKHSRQNGDFAAPNLEVQLVEKQIAEHFCANEGLGLGNLYHAFLKFDQDGSGFLDADEFRRAIALSCPSLRLSDAELYGLLKRYDINNDGLLSYYEFSMAVAKTQKHVQREMRRRKYEAENFQFVDMHAHLVPHSLSRSQLLSRLQRLGVNLADLANTAKGDQLRKYSKKELVSLYVKTHKEDAQRKKQEKDKIKQALLSRLRQSIKDLEMSRAMTACELFESYDVDGSGKLDADEFRLALDGLQITITDEQFKILMDFCDDDNNGVIDYYEFMTNMRDKESAAEDAPAGSGPRLLFHKAEDSNDTKLSPRSMAACVTFFAIPSTGSRIGKVNEGSRTRALKKSSDMRTYNM